MDELNLICFICVFCGWYRVNSKAADSYLQDISQLRYI